ncbi:MAG: PTS sugar transporter subunit IIA [Candidatus Endomicrobiellum trichonymphae]|uniref:Nitrogen regulatory protein PtsN n=1 Tax=Endomicrobium trichonymphae TaxID=1408204 RepID=B1H083_ENDTX|nr:PTS sugar transporter subunit IIA [Candidatus Endomicrobium trichonymphae]BAG13915.1 nitrogen regulatory protein PtsN [Candidatus Endomicrobium trichonymphae]BAV59007.1 nitrogen regulatory protein PtsN [Candidatus Endomicrobium trichonymphae]GMO54531.1 MAG: PTS sugar transporter subunit IIA [Candidatus Endomicrobium trichonymphae]
MKIMDFLSKDAIIIDMKSTDKKSAIIELVETLKKTKKVKKTDEIISIIWEREKLGSTGIGQGVAIPHGKTNVLQEHMGVLGTSHKGIEFNSLDGELVHIIFLLVGPVEVAGQHLKALSKISRLFKDKFLRQAIKDAVAAEEVVKIIEQEDTC